MALKTDFFFHKNKSTAWLCELENEISSGMTYGTSYLEKEIFCIDLGAVGELPMSLSGRREALFQDVLVGLRRKMPAE